MSACLTCFFDVQLNFVGLVLFFVMVDFDEKIRVLFDSAGFPGKPFAIELNRGDHDKL
jgi:hypothetical protein